MLNYSIIANPVDLAVSSSWNDTIILARFVHIICFNLLENNGLLLLFMDTRQ